RRVMDVYRLDLTTGGATLDTKNPGDVVGWEVDAKFKVRGAQASTPDGGMEIRSRADEKAPWQKVVKWGPDDSDGRVIDFTADGKGMWMLSSEGRDTLSLVRRDLQTGKEELIASDPKSDAAGAIVNPLTHEVEAVAFNRERVQWKALDKTTAEDLK